METTLDSKLQLKRRTEVLCDTIHPDREHVNLSPHQTKCVSRWWGTVGRGIKELLDLHKQLVTQNVIPLTC